MSEIACNAVVFNETKDRVLLVKRRDVPVWVLPGGAVDPGEEPGEAAVREVLEESGLQVELVRQVARYTPTGRLTCETHLFECQVTGGEIGTSDETLGGDFFPIDEWPPPVFDIHRNWLLDTQKNLPDIIVKPIEGLTWWTIFRALMRHPVLSSRFLLTRIGIRINSR